MTTCVCYVWWRPAWLQWPAIDFLSAALQLNFKVKTSRMSPYSKIEVTDNFQV